MEAAMTNSVFMARSLDGYVADKDGGLDWLNMIANPDRLDFGWNDFISRIDAVVMGRKTFDRVCSFDCPWPYSKPVFVLSRSLKELPDEYRDKAERISGELKDLCEILHKKGYENLYIDGGITVQHFLKEDLIDEMVLTTIPVLLGGGIPLFGELPEKLELTHLETSVFLGEIVQSRYIRKK